MAVRIDRLDAPTLRASMSGFVAPRADAVRDGSLAGCVASPAAAGNCAFWSEVAGDAVRDKRLAFDG